MSFFGGKSRTADGAAVQGTNAVTVEALKKKYPRAREYALKGISFSIDRGEIVGLLGHNGAGKSTTLKCLTGMLPFTEGEISVFGRSVKTDATAVKASFGFVTDNHAVFSKMTGLEYIAFMADIYGVSKEEGGQGEPSCRVAGVFRAGGENRHSHQQLFPRHETEDMHDGQPHTQPAAMDSRRAHGRA